ncbi:MAG: PhnD/SsuA/transferrin family substrate-binding protein [Actinomycetota bacterium]
MLAALPMYDWPEVADDVDQLWASIASELRTRGIGAPARLTRQDDLVAIWSDPAMIVGQVCSLNPVRDGLGETHVVGTLVYEPPSSLPQPEPGSYYSVVVCRSDDQRGSDATLAAFAGASVAANGTDSQSGYWSLAHHVRDSSVVFGEAIFTGAHRASIRAVVDGSADLAAIDVHSWRLACEYDPDLVASLRIVTTTDPTPGVVCVLAWELARHHDAVDAALAAAVERLSSERPDVLDRLHVSGYRSRRLGEFEMVAERVEEASRRRWHTPAAPSVSSGRTDP